MTLPVTANLLLIWFYWKPCQKWTLRRSVPAPVQGSGGFPHSASDQRRLSDDRVLLWGPFIHRTPLSMDGAFTDASLALREQRQPFFTQWKVNPCAFFAMRDVMCLMFRHLIFCFLCLYHLGLFLCAIDYVVFDHFFFLKILKTCQYSNICQWFVSIIATFNHPNRHFFYCIKDI
jgi:hypothetical protein